MATKEEIFDKVKDALVDALGVDDDEVTPEATLVGDLGAESIDFLDIVFRKSNSVRTRTVNDLPLQINRILLTVSPSLQAVILPHPHSQHNLQQIIRDSLYLALPDMYWVIAEISEIKENFAGHCFT